MHVATIAKITERYMALFATGPWRKPDYKTLERRSYLIKANNTYDVAFYEGRKPDGSPWWIMGSISLDPRVIEAIAEIQDLD